MSEYRPGRRSVPWLLCALTMNRPPHRANASAVPPRHPRETWGCSCLPSDRLRGPFAGPEWECGLTTSTLAPAQEMTERGVQGVKAEGPPGVRRPGCGSDPVRTVRRGARPHASRTRLDPLLLLRRPGGPDRLPGAQ